MRVIKFKGISTRLNLFVYGCLETHDIHNGVSIREGGCIIHKVDPETVGQYTGLKDRHGIEIYEGDFLKIGNKYGYYEAKVYWCNKRLCWAVSEKDFLLSRYMPEHMTVIGNIYQNKELAKSLGK